MHTPHDVLFAATFGHAHHAARWLRCVLPDELAAAIDWSSLRPLRERFPGARLRPHVADVVFAARTRGGGSERTVLVLLEHKSFADPAVEAQLLRYSVHLQRALQPHAAETPFVLPVLLRHGTTAHPDAPSARAPVPSQLAAIPAELIAAQPRQTIFVDDLDRLDEVQLAARASTPLGTLTLLCLKALGCLAAEEVPTFFERWQHLLRAVDRTDGPPDAPPLGPDAVDGIGWYALAVTEVESLVLAETFARILQRNDVNIMSTLERTFQKGLAAGKAEGIATGKAQGLVEGRALTLLQLLALRFGALDASDTARVRGASLEQLERWTNRVLHAKTIAAVFAEH